MTIDEAIPEFKERASISRRLVQIGYASNIPKAEEEEQIVEWLEELKQYRTIGTPEECRAAVEKQKPFKPETVGLTIGIGRCKCGAEFLDSKTNYCGNCGQKLNWNRRANDGKTD